MKHYFIAKDEIQTGPFTFEEVLSKKITKTTLVWSEGYDQWKEAIQIEEFKNIIIAEPPPIPKKTIEFTNTETEKIQEKELEIDLEISTLIGEYDDTYKKETECTFLGIGLGISALIINNIVKVDEQGHSAIGVLSLISIVIRIVVSVNIKKIALRQNRDSNGWALFGFILPTLALIIIGQLKKLNLNISNNDLQSKINQNILFKNAQTLFTVQKYLESIIILDNIIENSSQNFEYLRLRAHALYENEEFEKAKNDLQELVANSQYLDFAYNYLGEISIIHGNKELAISYWEKSKELFSGEAIKNLNIYKTFENKYILTSDQSKQKTQKHLNYQSTYFQDGQYIKGLVEIDDFEDVYSFSTRIIAHDMGISIELKKLLKKYYIAISYYEIENITYNETKQIFDIHLNDKNKLKFNYDIKKDDNKGLQRLQQRFYNLTKIKTDFSVQEK